MISEKAAAHYSFNRGTSRQNYPSSSMGFIALLMQTYLDAQWYGSQNPRPFKDQSLESWLATQSLPQIFEATDWLTVLRADKVGDEFGVQYIIKGGGDEYKRINEIKATNARLIVPINFPDAYDVEDPFDAERVTLADMKHWEMAPANLSYLESAGLQFAVTSHGLSKPAEFLKNLRKAVEYGLSEKAGLAALTTNPASMVNMGNQVGSLKAGMLANFIITSDNIFNEKAMIHENWIKGERFHYKDLEVEDKGGEYQLQADGQSFNLLIKGEPGKHKAEIKVNDTTNIPVEMKLSKELITLSFESEKGKGRTRLSGWETGTGFSGEGQNPDGSWVKWSATFSSAAEAKDEEKKRSEAEQPEIGSVIYPFVAHGTTTLPQTETILIKNATVWTNEEDGILEQADVLLKDGKITMVGSELSENGARVIDGTGKHLTPGIIDEHSHLAASSINDVAINSGMVRIGDVIDPEDIGVYKGPGRWCSSRPDTSWLR